MKNIKKYILIALILLSSFLVIAPNITFAKELNPASRLGTVVGRTGLSSDSSATEIATRVIKGILSTIGLIFLVLTVYAGILWMTARGNDEQVSKSRNILISSAIGMIVIVSSYAITNLVSDRLIQGNRGELPIGKIDETEENMACCIDWVQSKAGKENLIKLEPIPTGRITTEIDCKLMGEHDGRSDYHSGPEGEGYWMFFENIKTMDLCNGKVSEYASEIGILF